MIRLDYNLIVKAGEWTGKQDRILAERAFRYTDELLKKEYVVNGPHDFSTACKLPTIFMQESTSSSGSIARVAHVGRLLNVQKAEKKLILDFEYDGDVPPISNSFLERIAPDLHITPDEFGTEHWAIKRVNIFEVLFRYAEDAIY
jgi:hypothetical protein